MTCVTSQGMPRRTDTSIARIDKFVRGPVKVVDKFHFISHVGAFCRRFCNPNTWPELRDANMSIAEQGFQACGTLQA